MLFSAHENVFSDIGKVVVMVWKRLKTCGIRENGVARRRVRVGRCRIGVGNGLIGVGRISHSCRFILFAEINIGFRCMFFGNVLSLLVELQSERGCLRFGFVLFR